METREILFSENGFSLAEVTITDKTGKVIDSHFEIIGPGGIVMGSFDSLEEATLKFNTLVDEAKPKIKVRASGFSGPGM